MFDGNTRAKVRQSVEAYKIRINPHARVGILKQGYLLDKRAHPETGMKIITGTKKELASRAASILSMEIARIAAEKGIAVVGVPGGRSAAAIFESLSKNNVPWKKVHLFMVDERMVPIHSPCSNFRILSDTLLKKLGDEFPEENAHHFLNDADEAKALASYNRQLASRGGRLDIVLLSAGEDGHVASLFPYHPSIRDEGKRFIAVSDSPKPPAKRVSASRKLLAKSRVAILMFAGKEKKAAFRAFIAADDPIALPAALVKSIPAAYVLTTEGRSGL